MEELRKMAMDESIKVPEGLEREVSEMVGAMAFLEEENPKAARAWIRYAGSMAAAAVVLVALGVGLRTYSEPKDTFEDPALAYAELERTFSYISGKMNAGVDIAMKAEPVLSKPGEMLDRINR